MDIPATFIDAVKLIGSPLFVGIAVSLIANRFAWFKSQTGTVKFWLTGFFCVFLPVLSQAILTFVPVEAVKFLEAWWPSVVVGLGVWVSSQAWFEIFGNKSNISQVIEAHIGEVKHSEEVSG